jgi:hypothetical protein
LLARIRFCVELAEPIKLPTNNAEVTEVSPSKTRVVPPRGITVVPIVILNPPPPPPPPPPSNIGRLPTSDTGSKDILFGIFFFYILIFIILTYEYF